MKTLAAKLRARFFFFALLLCGMLCAIGSTPSLACAEQHTLVVTWDNPFPSESGLVRAIGDGGIWRFTLQLQGVVMSDGPHWSYPGKDAPGADPDWGLWSEDGLNLTWSAANTGLSFRVSVSGRIRPTGGGNGPLVEKEFEASWDGEVRDARNWQVTPDWHVGDIVTEHQIVRTDDSIVLWTNTYDEDHWQSVSGEGDELDDITYKWTVQKGGSSDPPEELENWFGDGSETFWNTPSEPGHYSITYMADDLGEVVDPDTGERDDGTGEVSIDITVADVKFAPGSLHLDLDETGALTATVLPSDVEASFEISDPTIATLEGEAPNLSITGLKNGTTTLIAKIEDEEFARATIVVGDGGEPGGDDDDSGGTPGGGGDGNGGGGVIPGGDDDDPGGPEQPCNISLNHDQVKRTNAHLYWSRCRDLNFVSYKLYRSTAENFTPDETTHIDRGVLETQQDKTEYDDTSLTAATTYYYVLQTTHDGQTTEARTSLTTPDAGTPELSFEGLARSCAGGLGADGVHDFTITGTLKDEDGVIMANTPLKFSFEGNKGHDYQAGERIDNQTGVLHRAKYVLGEDQTEVPDSNNEEMTAMTDTEGKVSVHVLSSDVISNDIKVVAKWANAQAEEKKVGDKACDFDAMTSIRRFPNPTDPYEPEDNGWIFDFPKLVNVGDVTPAKVYLKFCKDLDKGDINGNWSVVNGHDLLIKVGSVKLLDGSEVTGEPEDLSEYAIVMSSANGPSSPEEL